MRENKIHVNIDRLKRLYEEDGATIDSIAKALRCSKSVIASRIKEYGLKKKTITNSVSKELLEDLYNSKNLSSAEIAEILGLSCSSSVIRLLHKFNIPIHAMGGRYDIDKEELGKLYCAENKTCEEISKILNVSASVVRRRLNEFNIQIKGEKE